MENDIKEVLKIFVVWTKLKSRLHLSEIKAFPVRQEIWWASLGQNIGVETNGKNQNFERPVVVIKVFNTEGSLIAPVTSKKKEGKYFVSFMGRDGIAYSINMSQLKAISSKRLIRKVGQVNDEVFARIKEVYISFI